MGIPIFLFVFQSIYIVKSIYNQMAVFFDFILTTKVLFLVNFPMETKGCAGLEFIQNKL
jgi:hypothetical protein